MAKYVFPGADASMPLNWVIEQMERSGFEIESCETLGVHYSTTIFRWYENWMENKEKVIEKYGVRWFRVWEVIIMYFDSSSSLLTPLSLLDKEVRLFIKLSPTRT